MPSFSQRGTKPGTMVYIPLPPQQGTPAAAWEAEDLLPDLSPDPLPLGVKGPQIGENSGVGLSRLLPLGSLDDPAPFLGPHCFVLAVT